VLHEQLPTTVEQVGERAPAHWRVERVGLVDPHPGQRPALARDLVAEAGQLLLVRKQRPTLGGPLVPGYDAMVWGAHLGNGGSAGYVCFHRLGSFLRLSIRFSTLSVGHEDHLAPGIETVGVTSVTGFRWTR
jgi:hypothetical protein